MHEQLVEHVAEGKDELMEEFFEKGTLAPEHIYAGLHDAIKDDKIFPVLCGSALANIGTDLVMDFMLEFAPNPTEHRAMKAMVGDEEVERPITDKDHVTAYVFKTVADPFAGRLSFSRSARACSGMTRIWLASGRRATSGSRT
jgi:elongation factor G